MKKLALEVAGRIAYLGIGVASAILFILYNKDVFMGWFYRYHDTDKQLDV